MGPKKVKPSKKNLDKQKDKKIEDKTFGLKNKKKSKNVQNYIKEVSAQVKGSQSNGPKKVEMSKKKMKELKDAQMADLFKAAITQPKVPNGVDPKSIVCEFFKHNCCTKGLKCKFAHDLNAGRKTAKIDLYTDKRKGDEIDTWDQNKLESVIEELHGKANQTEIVCKYFLDAIEKSQYGWFWVCPNGGKACKYRHALPPGFVFKTKAERELERLGKKESDETSVEKIIEEQRAKLGATGGTPVTEETLKVWKKNKAKRKASAIEEQRKTEAKKSGGRGLNVLSGRALFSYDPSLFLDDESADTDQYLTSNEDVSNEDNEEALLDTIDESLYIQDE